MSRPTAVAFGALGASAGAALLIILIIFLLTFPVIKKCSVVAHKCEYSSTAPEPIRSIVSPGALAVSLILIASGVVALRIGTWFKYKG